MTSVTIVALPEQDEDVWKVSSDKKPHMTLLFLGELGDVTGLMQMRDYLEHVVSTMHRFWMDVDRRGTLGPEDADVLFFGKHNVEWLEEVRGHLLANTEIKKAYNAAPQFDSWIPHLTLGWPDSPAKDDAIEGRIYGVRFDRLALWINDFEGPEFIIPNNEDMVMADPVGDFLSHYGVKGMKWGVRRAQKKAARADKKWQKNVYSLKGAMDVHNHVAENMNSKIGALNAKHPKADLRESVQSKATRAYIREYEAMQLKGYQEAVKAVHGTSPSGTYKARYVSDAEGHRVVIERTDAQHAHEETATYTFELVVSDGKIVEVMSVRDELEQSDPIGEFLEHYGVKGMKWGVRKRSSGRSGGSGKTQFKKPANKLSNEEINRRIKRLETEKRYNSLNAKEKSKGREFAEGVLQSSARTVAKSVATAAATVAIKAALEAHGSTPAREVARRLG